MRKLLVALAALVFGLVAVPGAPAHAVDNGPTPSDVAPVSRVTGHQGSTGSPRAGTVDAANTFAQRQFPASSTPYNYFEAQFQITQDSPASGFFTINEFYVDGGSQYGGYIGLQTNLFMPGQGYVGKGAIFSLWKAGNGSTATCTLACTVVSGSELGEPFYSIHMPYTWVTGHVYQVEVQRIIWPCQCSADWRGYLHDLTTGLNTTMGDLFTSTAGGGGVGGFSPLANQWLEQYDLPASFASCADVPLYKSTFWSSIWLATGLGANAVPSTTTRYIDTTAGLCANSASLDGGTWPAGWPDPKVNEVIGSFSY